MSIDPWSSANAPDEPVAPTPAAASSAAAAPDVPPTVDLTFAESASTRYPEVITQLEKLQTRQAGWANAVLILVVSLVAFVGVGAKAWGWSAAALGIIVVVLFVHEIGHYVAMRVFRYRNVRMFFIPFFGAAVSGQHFHAPGWKKVVVSLMGPLPGIVLGSILGFAGQTLGHGLLTYAGSTALFINVFQLLPILPLDGGRVADDVLFCRNHYLSTAFQVLAVAALIGLGALLGDRVFMILGFIMLVGLPTSYKVAKLAGELRRQGLIAPVRLPGIAVSPMCPALPGRTPAYPALRPGPPMAVPPGSIPFARPLGAAPGPLTVPQAWPCRPPLPPAVTAAEASPDEAQSVPHAAAEAIIERVQAAFPQLKKPKSIAEMTLRIYAGVVARPPSAGASIGFLFLHGAAFILGLILFVLLCGGLQ